MQPSRLIGTLITVCLAVASTALGASPAHAHADAGPVASQATATSTAPGGLVTYGQPAQWSVEVKPDTGTVADDHLPAPSGEVVLVDGAGTEYDRQTLNAEGMATVTATGLAPGAVTLALQYAGDTVYEPSTANADVTVQPQGTSVTLSPSSTTTLAHEAITLRAQVATVTSPALSSPGGSVSFYDGFTLLQTVSPDATGGATATDVVLTTSGPHTLMASYSGEARYSGSSSSPTTVTAQQRTPQVTLASAANPSVSSEPVTMRAIVDDATRADLVPTGEVTFTEGTTTLGTSSLDSAGVAELTVTGLADGAHTVAAAYGGDALFAAGRSTAISQVVGRFAPAVTLATSASPSVAATPLTLTATVTGPVGGRHPSGTVTFVDGATELAVVPLEEGAANFTTSTLAPGTHSVTARYSGDGGYDTSTSAVLSQEVRKVEPASMTLASSPRPSRPGEAVTLTATVVPASGAPAPTGTVTFAHGTTSVGTAPLVDGAAELVTSTLPEGSLSLTASYGGDASYLAKMATVTHTVSRVVTTITMATVPSWRTTAQSLTFTATVTRASGSAPLSGQVTFFDFQTVLGTAPVDASGRATLTTTLTEVGGHLVHASYAGDVVHAPSSMNDRWPVSVSTPRPSSPPALGMQVEGIDPAQDNSGCRSDVASVGASYQPSTISVGVGIECGTNPQNDYRWDEDTFILWGVDVTGDDEPEYVVAYYNFQRILYADVYSADDFGFECAATPTWDGGRVYKAAFTPSCIDSPDAIRVFTIVQFDENGVCCWDLAPNDAPLAAISAEKIRTTTAVSASPTSVAPGTAVRLTAVTRPSQPSSQLIDGVTTFYDGSRVVGSASVDSDGKAILTVPLSSVGTHRITARYSGTIDLASSTSGAFSVVVKLPVLSASGSKVREGEARFIRTPVHLSLSQRTTQTVTVRWKTVDGTAKAGSDYRASSGTVTIEPGQTSKAFFVRVLGDRRREDNERFRVTLSVSNATLGTRSVVIVIRDDD